MATIVAADIAGYSRLMGANAEKTLSILKSYRKLIAKKVIKRKGRIFGVAGDSWMAEFQSPVEATRCALDIQKALSEANRRLPEQDRVHFRIGIHLGDVLIDGPDLFGDDVNIAARLQQLSDPGEIVISDQVFTHVSNKLDLIYRPLGQPPLKNISTPIKAFSVTFSEKSSVRSRMASAYLKVCRKLVAEDANRPTIAILPFQFMPRHTENTATIECLAGVLTMGLSQHRWLSVVSDFFKLAAPMRSAELARAIAKLNVRYALMSRVCSQDGTMSLLVNLFNVESGVTLFSRQFTTSNDGLDKQRKLGENLVSALIREIEKAEYARLRTKPLGECGAYELLASAAHKMRSLRESDLKEAENLLRRAQAKRPRSAEVTLQGAWHTFWRAWAKASLEESADQVAELARQVLSVDYSDGRAHLLLGLAELARRKANSARFHIANAIDLNPCEPLGHAALGSLLVTAGDGEAAASPLKRSILLGRHDPRQFIFYGELAMAHYLQGKWKDAYECAGIALQQRPSYWYAQVVSAASLFRLNTTQDPRTVRTPAPISHFQKKTSFLPFRDLREFASAWNRNNSYYERIDGTVGSNPAKSSKIFESRCQKATVGVYPGKSVGRDRLRPARLKSA